MVVDELPQWRGVPEHSVGAAVATERDKKGLQDPPEGTRVLPGAACWGLCSLLLHQPPQPCGVMLKASGQRGRGSQAGEGAWGEAGVLAQLSTAYFVVILISFPLLHSRRLDMTLAKLFPLPLRFMALFQK